MSLVINSNPCYAFLLDTNSLIQNKLIVAHVLAHCDFFKNNVRFSNTRQDMVESMTATAERIANYEMIHGKDEVERFLDAVLAIQEHIDPSILRHNSPTDDMMKKMMKKKLIRKTPYDDLWNLDKKNRREESNNSKVERKFLQSRKKIFCYLLKNIVVNWKIGNVIF